jgi:2-methylisocitrate lyase-like PEP mutase family enzyme
MQKELAMHTSYGDALRRAMADRDIVSFIGVYDTFSASLAAEHFDGLFVSGFSFAASHYGLPDIGFIAWPDIVGVVERIRTILPQHHIMVDMDDGYGDAEIAAHVTALLESVGASGIIMEDQKRPRRCGHYGGKQLLPLEEFLEKLVRVLDARRDLVVVARTDATDQEDRLARVLAFEQAGADAILADGLESLDVLRELTARVHRPVMFNQIAGGKSPPCDLAELRAAGISLVNYSTPCLFAAQAAIEASMLQLKQSGGRLPSPQEQPVRLSECTNALKKNLVRRCERVCEQGSLQGAPQ